MFKKIIKSIDYIIVGICFALFAIGIVALYSASGGTASDAAEWTKQLMWLRYWNCGDVAASSLQITSS